MIIIKASSRHFGTYHISLQCLLWMAMLPYLAGLELLSLVWIFIYIHTNSEVSGESAHLDSPETSQWDKYQNRIFRRIIIRITQSKGTLVFLKKHSVTHLKEWQQILKALLRRIISSIPDRCRACVAARGGHNPYWLGLLVGEIKNEIQGFPYFVFSVYVS